MVVETSIVTSGPRCSSASVAAWRMQQLLSGRFGSHVRALLASGVRIVPNGCGRSDSLQFAVPVSGGGGGSSTKRAVVQQLQLLVQELRPLLVTAGMRVVIKWAGSVVLQAAAEHATAAAVAAAAAASASGGASAGAEAALEAIRGEFADLDEEIVDEVIHFALAPASNLASSTLELPNTLNSFQRRRVHELAGVLELGHTSRGEQAERRVVLSRSS